MNHLSEHIGLLLSHLPETPGVYQMKNNKGEVIYIGKAKNLSRRVKSYFQKQKNVPQKVERMVNEICDIAYIEVATELDALILETNYIKEYKPKYNILMRDDKNHQYIKITTKEDYPRVYTTRKVLKDGALYFGPKTSSSSVYQTLKLLRKLFPYRTCTLDIEDRDGELLIKNKTIKTPCMYYHIKRCIAPCIKSCKEEYGELIGNMASFLSGEYKNILKSLEEKMHKEAQLKKFEQAAKSRDMIFAIKNLMEKQLVDQADTSIHQDIIGYALKHEKIFINLFQMRQGKLLGQENFVLEENAEREEEINKEELLRTFLMNYYQIATDLPNEILLPIKIQEDSLIETWFEKQLLKKIRLKTPQRGTNTHLIQLANNNAHSYAEQYRIKWQTDYAKTKGALEELALSIGLSTELRRMECYDISHLSGTATVGSMVVFQDGLPLKKDYRRFKIKETKEGEIDDFKSLQEMLSRRFKRIKELEKTSNLEENESLEKIPDLIIIDGGKGQLSSVMEIAEDMEIDIPIISLAKREEEIFLPREKISIMLPRDSASLYLIQNIRDEAHRFAITYNRNLRSKKMVRSLLDEVPGIGPSTKKKLLKTFGDVATIKLTSEEDIASVIGKHLAHTIKEYI